MKNAELIFLRMKNEKLKNTELPTNILRFPLRIGIISKTESEAGIDEITVRRVIDKLNHSFGPVGFEFYIEEVDVIISDLYIEDLSENYYETYNEFSDQYDNVNMINVYIFEHGSDFCDVSDVGISCGRTGGFSYVLSERTNNIVISKFDLEDQKVVAHEFGHFFGLYHTFEELQFGKDNFEVDNCNQLGDRICDTPPDAEGIYEIYVNYSNCEMLGLTDADGHTYKPLIENYMSYYKPCYMKEYSFTPGQIHLLRTSGMSELRKKYHR